ncbi:hypothetical protein C8R44DRAFT_930461 [Mycena epipterygia]|nr:hypothetical protein C8R44DRAFT_930461 [Mycena epipterygia]
MARATGTLLYAIVASFCAWGCVALVNSTIDATSIPPVHYNRTFVSCNNSSQCGFDVGPNRTVAIILGPGQITIPFTGTAVYVFLACTQDPNLVDPFGFFGPSKHNATLCEFDIDGTGARAVTGPGDIQLAYGNSSLPNGTHTLDITVFNGTQIAFDSVVYSFDDDDVGKKGSLPVGAIVGGIVGGLLLATAVTILYMRRRRRNTPGGIFLATPARDVEASPPQEHLAEQIRVLQAQTAELQGALRAQRAPSGGARLATMKREQALALREYAPAAGDLLLHTDSGLRLTPASRVQELPPKYAAD